MAAPSTTAVEKTEITDTKVEDVNTLSHDVEDDEEDFVFTFGKFLAVFSFFLGYLADVFSLTLSSAILTTINNDIGPSPNYAWIITSRLIVIAVMSPMVGRLSDIYGRRLCFLAGGVLGVVGSAISAAAQNINTMIGGGVIIGLSAAMHQLAWAALGEVVPKRTRPMAFGLMQTGLAFSSSFSAPIANSLVIHTGTWRYSYWLPLIVNGLALVLVFFFYRPMNQYIREEGKTQWQQVADLDWLGFFLLTAGLTLFLLGITFGGHRFPWVSAGTISMIIIGFFLLVVLGFYESYHSMIFPIFPPEIFRNIRGFTVVNVGIFLYGTLYYSTNVLWPQMVGVLFETDPMKIGWYTSAISMSGLVFGVIVGWLFRKIGHARWFFTFAIAAMTVVSGCMALVKESSKIEATVMVVLIGGLVTTAVVASQTMIQLGVRHEYLGVASAIANTARNLGGSVGTTIYTSILSDKIAHYVKPDVATPLAKAGVALAEIPGVITALMAHKSEAPALAALTPAQLAVAKAGLKTAYVHSFRIVYLVSIAFGVIATIAVSFSANVDKQMTKEVDIKLEEGAHIHGNTDTGEGHIIKRVD